MSYLKCLGSSSEGNCYILYCGNDILILELGINNDTILNAIGFEKGMSRVQGCLVTHKHKDHTGYINQFERYQIPIYSCKEVTELYSNVKLIECNKKTKIGNFIIQPISVQHSCECYAYLIEHEDMGKLLFATDCNSFKYIIKNLNHILIEANHDDSTILNNMKKNRYTASQFKNHMNFDDTLRTIKANNNIYLQNIILCHLSNSNSNGNNYIQSIKEEIGISNVFIADNGLKVDLSKEEF